MNNIKRKLLLTIGLIAISASNYSSAPQKIMRNIGSHSNNTTMQYVINLMTTTKNATVQYINNIIAATKQMIYKNQEILNKQNKNISEQDTIITTSLQKSAALNKYFGDAPKNNTEKQMRESVYNQYQQYVKDIQQPFMNIKTFKKYNDPFKQQENILFNEMIQKNIKHYSKSFDLTEPYNADLPGITTTIDPYTIHGELKPEYSNYGFKAQRSIYEN